MAHDQGSQSPDARGGAPASLRPRSALLLLAGTLALFFAPALLGGGEFVYRDTGRLHAPTKRWIAAELASGRIPEWNPYAGLGSPVIANASDAALHPLNLAFLILPPGAAMKAWILLSFLAAAAGAFAWARALGRSSEGALLGAVAFALSGPLVSSSDNVTFLTTYAALPWLFAAAHLYARDGGPAGLLRVGLASAACAAAGDPQAWGIGLGAVPLYALLAGRSHGTGRALARGGSALLAGAVAAAPFVLPVLLWLPQAGRAAGVAEIDAIRWNVHPGRLLELVVPSLLRGDPLDPLSSTFAAYAGNELTPIPWFLSLYLGAGVVALAVVGALRDRGARALCLGAALFGWASLGHHAGFGWLARQLPVVGAFRYWEKMAVWTALLLALAAARGADEVLAGGGARRMQRTAGPAALVFALLAAIGYLAPGLVHAVAGGPPEAALALSGNVAGGAMHASAVLALLAVVAAAVERRRLPAAAPLALLAVATLDLLGGNAGAYVLGPPEQRARPPLAAPLAPGDRVSSPFAEREDRWPELGRLGSTWEWNRRTLQASWNVPLRIGNPRDYAPLREARWGRWIDAIGAEGRWGGLGLWGFSHVVVPGNPELARRAGITGPLRVAAFDPGLPAYLVESPHRPRAYLADAYRGASAEEALAFALGGGEDGSTVVEQAVEPGRGAAGSARIARDLPGDTVVEAAVGGRGLLVLADLHAPGWTATIDGREVPIVRANGIVRGVWLEAGRHEVRFRYRTPGLAAGWALAGGGALVLIAWALARRRGAR